MSSELTVPHLSHTPQPYHTPCPQNCTSLHVHSTISHSNYTGQYQTQFFSVADFMSARICSTPCCTKLPLRKLHFLFVLVCYNQPHCRQNLCVLTIFISIDFKLRFNHYYLQPSRNLLLLLINAAA